MFLMLKYFFIIFLFFTSLEANGTVYKKSLNNNTLKSASELDYPPFSVVLADGKADGFSVELLKSSVEVMGGKIDFYVDNWNTIKQDLKKGKIDVLPAVGRTDEREEYYDFSIPYLVMHGAVFTRKNDNRIKTFEDLKNKIIVVMKGDNAEEYVRANNVGKEIITFDTYELALNALSSGKYDAVVIQKLVAVNLIKKLGIKNIKPADFMLEDFAQDFSFAVQKGNGKLLSLLNEGLAIVMANGTYNKLYEKWFHTPEIDSIFDSKIFKSLLGILILLIIGLLFFYIWNKTLSKKVYEKTKELDALNETLEVRVKIALDELHKKEEIMLLQSRQAIMGEMISMIAHQWRQPISAISMMANNILADIELDNLDIAELEDMTNKINIYIQELSKTIDDFRDFFKPNKSLEMVHIGTIIKETIGIIGKSLENNNIAIKIIEHNSTKEISTYPRELMQVFINIINNAKDILIEKKVNMRMIVISYEQSNEENIIITFHDNAGGIEQNIIEKVFDPYFSTKDKLNGTGLGLYIAKMIIEKHLFGKLSVSNEHGGACFKIQLPYSFETKHE